MVLNYGTGLGGKRVTCRLGLENEHLFYSVLYISTMPRVRVFLIRGFEDGRSGDIHVVVWSRVSGVVIEIGRV